MKVEITAKIASGYQAAEMFDSEDLAQQNLSLKQIRKQCQRLFELGKKGELDYFNMDLSKLPETVKFV